MHYLNEPYYFVYEVIIYWIDIEKQLHSFYKIGLIKVEREDRQLNYRYRREIQNGCKAFVINQIRFDNYLNTSEMEDTLLKIAEKEYFLDFGTSNKSKKQKQGDLNKYPHYFAGSLEAFKTPKRLSSLIFKLKNYFDKNPDVFYPREFNHYLLNKANENQIKKN